MENPISRRVGERVARVRSELGLTQADLAAEMTARLGREIRPLTVTRLEGGKRPIPVDELVVVAEVLRIEPSELLSEGDLPMGAVIATSAGLELFRASNRLTSTVREWIRAKAKLRQILESPDNQRYIESMSPATRVWLNVIDRQELWQIVEDAEEDVVQKAYGGVDGDDESDA